METNHKYNKAIVFSGGGTRFAIYCGIFTALEDIGLKPDLIIASCGGAIAATIINSFQTNEERKAYLQSEELFEFIRNTQLTKEKMLNRIGWDCLKMIRSKDFAPHIENIFEKYLVDMPIDLEQYLPSLSSTFGLNIPSILIGSRVLFDKSAIGRIRNNKKLFRKVIFTDKNIAQYIDCEKIEIQSDNYFNSAIDSDIEIITDIPMITAMRISMSDMFYVQPVHYQNQYYMGGAVDLVPVELAQFMADFVILEKKREYSRMEESIVRAVFGFSGNQRLDEIKNKSIDYWINTSDDSQSLKGYYVQKKIDWLRFQVKMILPDSFQKFKEDMEFQWQYGYKKAAKLINQ